MNYFIKKMKKKMALAKIKKQAIKACGKGMKEKSIVGKIMYQQQVITLTAQYYAVLSQRINTGKFEDGGIVVDVNS